MHLLRLLATVAVTTSLLATPALTLAQSSGSEDQVSAPLARQPDGLLPLDGTPWRLSGYRFNGVAREPGPEVAATLTLNAGQIDASGGCTPFRGTYGATGSAIRFELKGLKENDCAEQTMIVQLGMIEGLRKAASYRLEAGVDGRAGVLVFESASGNELLRFRLDDIGPLTGVEWRLASYTVDGRTTEADPSQASVLLLGAGSGRANAAGRVNVARRRSEGPTTGSTGCNGFGGIYYRYANVMSFGELSRTEAACPAGLAAQEAAIFAVLDATAIRLLMPPDRLLLSSAEGDASLEYLSSRPAEGATWLLRKLPGSDGPADIVTLRLDEGTLAGEGPCGPYGGNYVSDGVFITFGEVRGAGDDACAESSTEKKLLAALRSAVTIERAVSPLGGKSQLTLRDAQGRPVARFNAPTAAGAGT